jgi:transketolase
MRNTFADTFYEAGKHDPRLVVVVADISPAGSIAKFREDFPQRFINTGVAEQIMIGLVAGMAHRGLRPFAYTIATFTLFRPYEMIRDDLCYQNLPVTVVGIGGGVTYSTLGATHHAQEDIGLACGLPNMTVLAPCDPAEVRAATEWCISQKRGPVYLRLAKAGEPPLTTTAEQPWKFGKLRVLRQGHDVCIIAYGPIMKMALDVATALEGQGKSVTVASCHTIKPLDRDGIAAALARHKHVVVIEEAAPNGALGQQVKALAWETEARCRLDTFALDDAFHHVYGNHDELLAAHGLSVPTILGRISKS